MPLSRDRVLDAALTLVDRDGIAKLSMRRLGAELGVEAMTLYYYVPNKAALLDGLVELVVEQAVRDVPRDGDWQTLLRGFATAWRTELLRHPGVLPLLATRPVMTDTSLRTLESAARTLHDAGFTAHQALHLINIVATFVIGHTLAEAGTTPGHESDTPDPATALAALDPSEFPTLHAALSTGLGEDHQERFDLALDVILTGLESRLRG